MEQNIENYSLSDDVTNGLRYDLENFVQSQIDKLTRNIDLSNGGSAVNIMNTIVDMLAPIHPDSNTAAAKSIAVSILNTLLTRGATVPTDPTIYAFSIAGTPLVMTSENPPRCIGFVAAGRYGGSITEKIAKQNFRKIDGVICCPVADTVLSETFREYFNGVLKAKRVYKTASGYLYIATADAVDNEMPDLTTAAWEGKIYTKEELVTWLADYNQMKIAVALYPEIARAAAQAIADHTAGINY